MITTSQEWKNNIYENRSALLLRAELKLDNGETMYLDYEDGDDDFLSSGISLEDNTSADNTFTVGSAVMNTFGFKLNNNNGRYDAIFLQGAEISPEIGMNINGTVEWIKKGVFIVNDPAMRGNVIVITAYDRMVKTHKDFSEVKVTFPITMGALALAICDYCGIELATEQFPNYDYVITSAPINTTYNCRQMLSFIAQIAGGYARFNNEGKLEITWYGSSENEIPNYVSLDADILDTTITGVKVASYYSNVGYSDDAPDGELTETSMYGEEGYVISIVENPLILYGESSNVSKIIGERIVGTRFRSLNLKTLYDPSLEAGDMISITDVRGNSYVSFITNLSVNFGGYVNIACGAETAEENAVSSNYAGNSAVVEATKIANAKFKNLVTVQLEAQIAKFKYLTADKADLKYANIDEFKSVSGKVEKLETKSITTDNLEAKVGEIDFLKTDSANARFASIDFSNIGEAAMRYFYANSGLIKNVTIENGTLTGELIGVTIKGDLIEGNTIKADKLVVKGTDGIYYKLNFEAGTFKDGEAVPDDGLHGSVIVAKSITAEKVSVSDLVAFDATIGGFNIKENSIYSGVKESVDNTTEGIYMDKEGQMALGNGLRFLKFYKTADGDYKLEIQADVIKFGDSKKGISEAIADEVSNVQVGGRNLIRNSDDLIFDDYYFTDQEMVVMHDNEGNVVVIYTPFAVSHDGAGNVTIENVTTTDDGLGNVIIGI